MSGVDPINYDVGELRDLAEEDRPEEPDDGEGSGRDGSGATGADSLDDWNWGIDHVDSSEETSGDAGDREGRAIAPEMTEWEPGPSGTASEAGDPGVGHSREKRVRPGGQAESDSSEAGDGTNRSETDRPAGAGDEGKSGAGDSLDASEADPVEDTEAILRDVKDRLTELREQRVDVENPDSTTPTDSAGGGTVDGEADSASRGTHPADADGAGSPTGRPVGPGGADPGPADERDSSLVEDDWPPWGADEGDRTAPGETRARDEDGAVGADRTDEAPGATVAGGAGSGSITSGPTGRPDGDDTDAGDETSSLSAAVAATLDEQIPDGKPFDTDDLDLGDKPYLGYVPRDAEDLVAEWLDFLVAKGGTDGAVRALDGYRSTGWITVGVTVDLRSRVEARGHVAGDFDDLGRGDHYRSLRYIDKITGQ